MTQEATRQRAVQGVGATIAGQGVASSIDAGASGAIAPDFFQAVGFSQALLKEHQPMALTLSDTDDGLIEAKARHTDVFPGRLPLGGLGLMRAASLLATILAVSACSNPRTASEANFKAAIQGYFASAKQACLDFPMDFPQDRMEGYYDFEDRSRLFDELVAVGFLRSEPVQKHVRKNLFSFTFPGRKPEMKTISGKRYSITEAGMVAGGPSPGAIGASFCYGSYEVRDVTNFTEPAVALGKTISTVSYTFAAEDIADWARNSELLRGEFPRLVRDLKSLEEPINDEAVLILTRNGWVHSAMFGR